MIWSVDGYEWDIPCTIDRVATVEASEISGMMMNLQYLNDVLGTWLKYTITVAVPKGYEQEYTYLYSILTNPSDAHDFVLPYGEGRINLSARVQTVSDHYVRLPGGKQMWRKTTFDVISNHPIIEADGTQIGLPPMPEGVEPDVGDIFEYTEYGWIQRNYEDADTKEY